LREQNDRFWHETAVPTHRELIRCWGKSELNADIARWQFLTQSGHARLRMTSDKQPLPKLLLEHYDFDVEGEHMEHAYQRELWHDLYVMLGTSSAALIGLLFVVTSLHLKEIVNNPIFRLRARRNSIYLIITMVEAALILTPQPIVALGIEVTALNGFGLLLPLSNVYHMYNDRSFAHRGGFSPYRTAIFIICFLLGVAGGASLIVNHNYGLYLITASCLTLLVSVALNAWLIMQGVGQSEKKRKTKQGSVRRLQ